MAAQSWCPWPALALTLFLLLTSVDIVAVFRSHNCGLQSNEANRVKCVWISAQVQKQAALILPAPASANPTFCCCYADLAQ